MTRGHGAIDNRDGLMRWNVFAAYLHLHALGTPGWAPRFVAAASRFQQGG